jgi:hypothetical protein
VTGTYRRLPVDTSLRRPFAITIGLAVGYDDGPTHDPAVAVDTHAQWMKDRIAAGEPYLTGVFTQATLSYAWPRPEHGSEGVARAEPALVFSGDVSVLYAADVTNADVTLMLDDLAGRLGAAFGQTRVYVAYRSTTWVLEATQ